MLRKKNDYHLVHYVLTVTHSEGSYPIFIGENLLTDKDILNSYAVGPQVAIITDTHVEALYMNSMSENFYSKQCDTFVLSQGECSKTMNSFLKVVDFLSEKQHHRDTTLIALGGGVVGDLTGFVAACYHRGVSFIQVPTTLLSQVDSSIGGKTAVNQAHGKNLLGAFYQPKAVIIDLNTLDTLSDREYKSGMAEIIKAALIKDAFFFSWLEAHMGALLQREKAFLKEAIFRACSIKQAVVIEDEKDKTGARALLNFGHTFGHAIENNLGYGEWLHGEAVALGLRMASELSYELELLKESDLTRIQALLDYVGYSRALPSQVTKEQMLLTMNNDKKVFNNQLHFVVLNGIGAALTKSNIKNDTVESIIAHYKRDNND